MLLQYFNVSKKKKKVCRSLVDSSVSSSSQELARNAAESRDGRWSYIQLIRQLAGLARLTSELSGMLILSPCCRKGHSAIEDADARFNAHIQASPSRFERHAESKKSRSG